MKQYPITCRGHAVLVVILTTCLWNLSAAQVSTSPPHAQLAQPAAIPEIPAELSSRYARLQGALQPGVRAWVAEQARLQQQKPAPDRSGLDAAIRARFAPAIKTMGVGTSDIEALAFIVMMQATNDMDKDLKSIMAELKSFNESKQKMRDLIARVDSEVAAHTSTPKTKPCLTTTCISVAREVNLLSSQLKNRVRTHVPGQLTYETLAQVQQQLRNDLGQMNDVSDLQSLRLQQTMERRSKFINLLSNIMKNLSTTSESIVRNLK